MVTRVRSQGSPLLNAVKLKHLEVLPKTSIVELIQRGNSLPDVVMNAICQECGGHPFIAQYILAGLWQLGKVDVTQNHVDEISHQMRLERNADFSDWWHSLGDSGQRAYSVLSDTKDNEAHETELLRELQGTEQLPSEGLSALCYHGLVVYDRNARSYRVTAATFQKWYRENIAPVSERYVRTGSKVEANYDETEKFSIPELHKTQRHFRSGYALLIGVGTEDIPNTVTDAQALNDILLDLSRCAYPPQQVRLLTSSNATRENILTAFDWLASIVSDDNDATVLVFFSGHGGLMPHYHIVPHGYDYRSVQRTSISGDELTKKLAAIQSKKLLILLDCCHAGGIVTLQKSESFQTSPYPPEMEKFLASGSGRVLIASSRRDEVSYAGSPLSVFTQAIVEGLAGYGASESDGYTYVTDLALYAGRMVPIRTRDTQHPILKLMAADNFPVSYYAGGAKQPLALQGFESTGIIPSRQIQTAHALTDGYTRIVQQYKSNLLRIEERMARFIDQAAVPLDLERQKQEIISKIVELEKGLH